MNATALNFWSLGSPGTNTALDGEAVGAKRDKSDGGMVDVESGGNISRYFPRRIYHFHILPALVLRLSFLSPLSFSLFCM
jgi:hypothetical protein